MYFVVGINKGKRFIFTKMLFFIDFKLCEKKYFQNC